MGTALSIGVGFAVALATVRILVPSLQLWHVLLPGYIIAISMMYFVPTLFVGIAFDAGGVATEPMTATFILAFVQGAASAFDGHHAGLRHRRKSMVETLGVSRYSQGNCSNGGLGING